MNWRSSYTLPIVISVGMHLALIAVITLGWETTAEVKPRVFKPKFVEAKLVELKAQSKEETAPAQNKVIDLTKQRELERQQAEAERKAREQAARKRQQEQERKQKAEAERKRKQKEEAERQRQQELEAKRRAEEAAQKKAEQERRERLEKQRLEEQKRKAEAEARQQAELAAAQTQSYVNMIAARVEQNWSRPPSARRGMRATLLIQLVPTGQVVNVTVIESSGNAAFDRSAEQAVRRVDRFTELQNMPPKLFEENFRQLRLEFKPEDLRL